MASVEVRWPEGDAHTLAVLARELALLGRGSRREDALAVLRIALGVGT